MFVSLLAAMHAASCYAPITGASGCAQEEGNLVSVIEASRPWQQRPSVANARP